MSQATRP